MNRKIIYTIPALAVVGLAAACGTTASPAPSHSVPVQQQQNTTTPAAPAPAPPPSPTTPPAGQVIATYTGTGNQNTPDFNAPANGRYIVEWQYSGNSSPYGGTNFIISSTDSMASALGLPNDIADHGSGSTEVTDASGVQSFNVQSVGQWTITVKTA